MASLELLDGEHLQPLRRAITNCLATSAAEYAYTQILDGRPTSYVFGGDHYMEPRWPIYKHKQICPGFLDKAKAFRSDFDVLSLKFEAKTLQAYQDAKCNSVAWKLRLIELVVVACHDIAIFLYKMDDGAHKHAEHEAWLAKQREKYLNKRSTKRMVLPPRSLFWHGMFRDHKRYPNGVAELAGYWAEGQIFGGAVMFDRGESGEECNGMYIYNPVRYHTFAPPTEEQFNQLVEFLVSPDPDHSRCPIPIKVTPDNWWRWDPIPAMTEHNIFRNRYEVPDEHYTRSRRQVITDLTWPESAEDAEAVERAARKAAGEPYDDLPSPLPGDTRWLQITPTSFLWDERKDAICALEPDKKKQGRPPYFFDP
ncbi:hypothetical protein KVR01_013281 [Diaporthe batatas]|uniref:uncharacterized protein n=1 Tax=Diaporthe batatas TaxID=748121 RepID=UPI001D03E4DC|nr:uncharacterized protein KVR01_013281 [Diaporthe batatas]KAG8156868.1 hypothetical protein KVR01_013281 [Diaporthe batatas]